MHILITGAAGMIGRKLTARLVKDGSLNGRSIDRLTLIDVVAPEKPAGFSGAVELSASDLSAPGVAAKAIAGKPDVIFHLAGVVSGEAETDFEKGYRVNLDGTRALLEAIRAAGLQAKGHVHVVDRGLRRTVSALHSRRISSDAAHLVRHAEGDLRIAARRLLRDAASSKASVSGCRQSACGPASPTKLRPASFPESSANRSPARRRCCQSPIACAIRMRVRAPRSAFSFTPRA